MHLSQISGSLPESPTVKDLFQHLIHFGASKFSTLATWNSLSFNVLFKVISTLETIKINCSSLSNILSKLNNSVDNSSVILQSSEPFTLSSDLACSIAKFTESLMAKICSLFGQKFFDL